MRRFYFCTSPHPFHCNRCYLAGGMVMRPAYSWFVPQHLDDFWSCQINVPIIGATCLFFFLFPFGKGWHTAYRIRFAGVLSWLTKCAFIWTHKEGTSYGIIYISVSIIREMVTVSCNYCYIQLLDFCFSFGEAYVSLFWEKGSLLLNIIICIVNGTLIVSAISRIFFEHIYSYSVMLLD
jgi:hypothetical protein